MKIIKKLKKFKKEQNEDNCINLKYKEVIHILKKIKKSSNDVKNSSIQKTYEVLYYDGSIKHFIDKKEALKQCEMYLATITNLD